MKREVFVIGLISIILASCSSSIQKRFSVTEYLRGPYINQKDNQDEVSKKCMLISLSQAELDDILKNGAKVISTTEYNAPVTYGSGFYKRNGSCMGTTYILEGPKKILSKYKKLDSIPEPEVITKPLDLEFNLGPE